MQHIVVLSIDFGDPSLTDFHHGLLSNGNLVSVAAEAKFTVLLTRDRLFGESAASALKGRREFCIVRKTLPQLRAPQFLQAFRAAWQNSRIITASGQMIEWPAR
jgi:hypothetical protein